MKAYLYKSRFSYVRVCEVSKKYESLWESYIFEKKFLSLLVECNY